MPKTLRDPAREQFWRQPWTWLKDTLTALPTTPTDQLAMLLPTNAD